MLNENQQHLFNKLVELQTVKTKHKDDPAKVYETESQIISVKYDLMKSMGFSEYIKLISRASMLSF